MINVKEITNLMRKDYLLDMRSKSILLSTLLYIFSTVFVCFLSFRNLGPDHWNSLFWIIALFAVTNAGNKIFINESGAQRTYLYTLAGARSVIISKLIYQWIFTGFLALLVAISCIVLFNARINHPFYFGLAVLLGIWAMSNILTLNNALSSSTTNSPTVLAILSFPILLPVLMTTIKASRFALMTEINADLASHLLVLVLLNALTAVLAIILFPYLWRY
jgi:heme exporter protein B